MHFCCVPPNVAISSDTQLYNKSQQTPCLRFYLLCCWSILLPLSLKYKFSLPQRENTRELVHREREEMRVVVNYGQHAKQIYRLTNGIWEKPGSLAIILSEFKAIPITVFYFLFLLNCFLFYLQIGRAFWYLLIWTRTYITCTLLSQSKIWLQINFELIGYMINVFQ